MICCGQVRHAQTCLKTVGGELRKCLGLGKHGRLQPPAAVTQAARFQASQPAGPYVSACSSSRAHVFLTTRAPAALSCSNLRSQPPAGGSAVAPCTRAADAFSPLGCKCSGAPRIMHLACSFNIHAIRFHHTRRCRARLLICQKFCAKRGGFLVPVQLERLARPLGLLPLLRGRGQGGRLLALFFALRVRAGLTGAAVWGQSDALWRQGSAGPGLRPARPFPK